jgi:YggT family protein
MIGYAIIKLLDLLSLLIVIRCLMTWFPGATHSKFYEIISTLTNPIEEPIREFMYKFTNGPIDFSPLIAILLIQLLQRIVAGIF